MSGSLNSWNPQVLSRLVQGLHYRRFQWPLACWYCGFESCRGHGCLFLVSVVCYHVEVSASGRSLVRGVLLLCCKGATIQYSRLVLERQNLRHYGREIGTRTRSPGTLSDSVPPSLVCVIRNIVGTSRDYLSYYARGMGFSDREQSNHV